MSNLDVILANKPSGVSTHRVSAEKPGFCEWLEKQLSKKLFPVHRLDKETTGAILFATTSESAAQLTQAFTSHRVQKTYLFITDKKPQHTEWTQQSLIEKHGKEHTSVFSTSPNSTTHFKVLKQTETHFVIEAKPESGKTHQIRLHAKDSKIPLLGDSLYGGTPFPQFYLHSLHLECPELNISHTSPPPIIYDHLEWLQQPELCQWVMSWDRRQRLYPELVNSKSCIRLIHNEGTPLRADQLGEVVFAGWWQESPPSEQTLKNINKFFEAINISNWCLQHYRKNKNLGSPMIYSSAPTDWIGVENSARYHFHQDVGSSPGLFLDQRDQRHWVKNNSRAKKVLNLFAYTGGFSLMAALGGAEQVVTVDLSKKYIDWSKKNFELNHISLEPHRFYDMDSLEYLKYAFKKQMQFDVIICDPPSFSRNKGKVFQVEKDFSNLIHAMNAVLAKNGVILFSTNFEQWDAATWDDHLSQIAQTERLDITRVLNFQWDFETDPSKTLMKAFQITK